MNHNSLKEDFYKSHAGLEIIPFDPKWMNGTGYLNGAVAYSLESGKRVATVVDSNRKAILIGTPLGTVIVFERYNPETTTRSFLLVYNAPQMVSAILGDNPLQPSDYHRFIHYDNSNIGTILKAIDEDLSF